MSNLDKLNEEIKEWIEFTRKKRELRDFWALNEYPPREEQIHQILTLREVQNA
jgi:hypothetical protein